MTSIEQILNRPAEEVASSHTAAAIPSLSSDGPPTSTSSTLRAHKYSNSADSIASFASSSRTNPFGSHTRTSSNSTNPDTPQTDYFPLTSTFTSSIDSNIGTGIDSNKMADMVDPIVRVDSSDDLSVGSEVRAQSQGRRLADGCTIDLTHDDGRAESPTDAVMPMMSRATAGPSATSSPFTQLPNPAAPDATANLGSADERTMSAFTPRPSVMLPAAPAQQPAAPIFPPCPAYNPSGTPRFRLSRELIDLIVPSQIPSEEALMEDIDFTEKRTCRFMDGVCDMSANLETKDVNWRKSMSHIFGRNKNCTRSIPEDVWLWVCRKHYQRGRYRNAHDYSIKLARLVILQIARLTAWSNYNEDMGNPQNGIVVHYVLMARRRAEDRLQSASRKRKASGEADGEAGREAGEEDSEADEPGRLDAENTGAVPAWLLAMRGKLMSTKEVVEMLLRIISELENRTLDNFPDIEILPHITGDQAKPKSKRVKARSAPARKPAPDAKSLPHRGKRQRPSNEEPEHLAGNRDGYRHPAPNSRGPANSSLGNERYGYGSHSGPQHGAWSAQQHDGARGHLRAHSWDSSSGSYNQLPMHLQAGAAAGYAQQPSGYAGYAGYTQQAGYGQGRGYMRSDNGYGAQQPSQNGYWDPGYDARQHRLFSQQQPTPHPQGGFYYSPATIAAGAPQGGPPPAAAAKHTRGQSTPYVRPASMMMGGAGRPQEGGYSAPQMAPHEGVRARHEQTAAYSTAAQDAAAMYAQPSQGYQMYGSLPMANSGDNAPHRSGYGSPAASMRLPPHDGAPATESYEGYTPASLRR